jgi:hypothetical protein
MFWVGTWQVVFRCRLSHWLRWGAPYDWYDWLIHADTMLDRFEAILSVLLIHSLYYAFSLYIYTYLIFIDIHCISLYSLWQDDVILVPANKRFPHLLLNRSEVQRQMSGVKNLKDIVPWGSFAVIIWWSWCFYPFLVNFAHASRSDRTVWYCLYVWNNCKILQVNLLQSLGAFMLYQHCSLEHHRFIFDLPWQILLCSVALHCIVSLQYTCWPWNHSGRAGQACHCCANQLAVAWKRLWWPNF